MERLYFPATIGNRQPIWEVLEPWLSQASKVLEIASGSGEHLSHFAERAPKVEFTPSDPHPSHRESQVAWCEHLPNVLAPIDLDCLRQPWPLGDGRWDGILAINLIHIAPVSYTHLDVYKRQTPYCPMVLRTASALGRASGWVPPPGQESNVLRIS